MKDLCNALIDAARFLELSGDDIIDPDAAVAAMEEMGAVLRSATLIEKQAFVSACQTEANRLRSAGELQSGKFVDELPTAMGLQVEV